MENVIKSGAPQIKRTSGSVHPYEFKAGDSIMSLIALVVGFLFWEWYPMETWAPTLGTFFFLMLVTISTAFYMKGTGIKQSKTAMGLMGILILTSCYYLVFDNTPLHSLVFIFAIYLYVAWVMAANGTSIMKNLNGFIIGDFINQTFVIPFANFIAMFHSILSKDKSHKKNMLSLLIGLVVSVPLICFVVVLLSKADTGFHNLVDDLILWIEDFPVTIYVFQFFFGIPIACYFYGFVYGNNHKRKSDLIKYASLNNSFIKLHVLPKPAVYGPLVSMNIIYIVFFIAMGSYLFSAFQGDLPASMTYAEYARRGFFELCAVAAINLAVIVFSYTFVNRTEGEYPKSLKLLTGIMSLFTMLLVATAMSKMIMYIGTYGLTQLRIYTFWFMIVIMLTFLLLLIWHVKSYNIGKPLIIGFMVLFLALAVSNTDGQIAKYNINAYENGKLAELDTQMLYDLSDAVIPYVAEYKTRTKDSALKEELNDIIYFHIHNESLIHEDFYTYADIDKDSVFGMNLQRLMARSFE